MNRWLILAVLFFARTAMGFQFQSVASVSPLPVRDLGIDFARLGMLGVAVTLPLILATPAPLPGRALSAPARHLGLYYAGMALVLLAIALTFGFRRIERNG